MMRYTILALAALAAGCAPRRVHERPILENGDRVGSADGAVAVARAQAERDQAQGGARRDELAAAALADCLPAVCRAVARGEVALGMNEAQVMAATRTHEGAWTVRQVGGGAVMVPHALEAAPRDALGELAMLQLKNGRVAAYSYREAQGIRVVTEPSEATTVGRAGALAELLIREGDDLTARGDLEAALDRYDRADVLRTNDPLLDYKIASLLDKKLRPIEALIRYQLFLHRLELEKIDAYGRAYGNLASAIAHARERIIVLEKHGR